METSTSNDTLSATLPNPFTPMAFLPEELAFQVTVSIYIFVGATSVMIWDILNNLRSDYCLLVKNRIGGPTIAYFVSRLGALGFVLASTIFTTAPTGNCAQFEKGLDWLYPIGVPATSLLFFFRVRAVFDRNKYVTAFFALLWLAVLGGCLTVTQGVVGMNIGTTAYCINAGLASYLPVAAIVPLINDTLVFSAITWRLMKNGNWEYSVKDGVRTLVFGDYLPAFSKALLQDGQIYYLTTVTANLLTLIMLYVNSVPVAYRTMFTVPNVVLMNIMACRVYRHTKLGLRNDSEAVNDDGKFPLAILAGRRRSRRRPELDTYISDAGGIEVTKTIELHDDEAFRVKGFSGMRTPAGEMV